MAYISHGTDHKDLIKCLKEPKIRNLLLLDHAILRSPQVEETMLKVDRKYFSTLDPYADKPQKIGFGATISAPHMISYFPPCEPSLRNPYENHSVLQHVCALEVLKDYIKKGSKVLDIGSGSGYLTACFGTMVWPDGKVIGIDHIPELVTLSLENINQSNQELIDSGVVQIYADDGRLGYSQEAPYDAIHVGAAAEIVPKKLTDQLKAGGCMVLPVGKQFDMQNFVRIIKKSDGSLSEKELMSVRYVPLTSVEGQMTGRPEMLSRGYKGSGSITKLVDDNLLQIFSYFTLKEWLAFEMVCKRWNRLIKKQWKSLKFANLSSVTGTPIHLFTATEYFTPDVGPKMIAGLAERCGQNLRWLKSGCRLRIDALCLDYLSQNFPKLQSLDFSQVVFSWNEDYLELEENERVTILNISGTFQNLHELILEKTFDDSAISYHSTESVDPLLYKLFRTIPNLEKLSLSYCTMINGYCLLGVSQNLKSLDLAFCRRISSEVLGSVLNHLVNLEEISLYSCHKIEGSPLLKLPPSVKSVDFSFCRGLSSDVILEFLNSHQQLQTIRVAHLNCLTNQILFEISHQEYLETLDLSSYYCESWKVATNQYAHHFCISNGLKAVAKMGQLKILELGSNDFVEDAILLDISAKCKNLEELNASKLSNCTEIGFASLGNLPHIQRLNISGNQGVNDAVLLALADAVSLEFVNARVCSIDEDSLRNVSQCWPNKTTVFQIY